MRPHVMILPVGPGFHGNCGGPRLQYCPDSARIRAMSADSLTETAHRETARRSGASRLLFYSAWFVFWYWLLTVVMWQVGIEAIYQHPTPFYALPIPAFSSALTPLTMVLLFGLSILACREGLFGLSSPLSARLTAVLAVLGVVAAYAYALAISSLPALETLGAVWAELRWHLLAAAVFAGAFIGWKLYLDRCGWFAGELDARSVLYALLALFGFLIVFSCAVAMIRGGTEGIAFAYSRKTYEYVGDIGSGGSIRGLFRDYVELHPYLSMHSKVHPPGPVALLWVFSGFLGPDSLVLSIATVVFGSLAIFPLYGWVRDMTGSQRTGLTCCALYALVPSIVLFTATSADILFMPFTLGTLFLFWRAIHRKSIVYALAAGLGYGLMSLLSFSLIGVGAFFGLVGLWRLASREYRVAVVQTAVLMVAVLVGLHALVWWWSGFDVTACFTAAKGQFDLDQFHLDAMTPRYPAWTFKFWNLLCWIFFAGAPVTVLLVWRLARSPKGFRAVCWICAAMILILDALYLARGEGERSAMYVFPFFVIPAGHLLDELATEARSLAPLAVALIFLALQTWAIETYLFTYW